MANKATAEVTTVWADIAGNTRGFTFHLELVGGANSPNITTMTANAQSIIEKLEPLTDCKFISASITLPFNPTVTDPKADPTDDSRARRHAKTFWLGAADENGVAEVVEIGVPDPTTAVTDFTVPQPALFTTGDPYTALVTAVTTNAKTRGGEAVASYKGSIIAQRPVTATSRQ